MATKAIPPTTPPITAPIDDPSGCVIGDDVPSVCPVEVTVGWVVGLGEVGETLVFSSTVVGVAGDVTFRTEVTLLTGVTVCTDVTKVVVVLLIVVYLVPLDIT